jgi:hypothetical protein
MISGSVLFTLTVLVDVLVFVFLAFAGRVLRGLGTGKIALILLPVVLWGVLWTYVPELVALRRETRLGVPISIAVSLLYLQISLRGFGRGGGDAGQVLRIAGWRVVFGGLLAVIGFLGGLPPGFYISAAIGDIAVGLWGLALWARGTASHRSLIAWNIIGLADLLHVLAVGALYLVPFFQTHPTIPVFGMLPTVGVPLFIALHIVALRVLLRAPQLSSSIPERTI